MEVETMPMMAWAIAQTMAQREKYNRLAERYAPVLSAVLVQLKGRIYIEPLDWGYLPLPPQELRTWIEFGFGGRVCVGWVLDSLARNVGQNPTGIVTSMLQTICGSSNLPKVDLAAYTEKVEGEVPSSAPSVLTSTVGWVPRIGG